MKPELFLQTDLLDILFNGRNKAYGAYILRKQYNVRLIKATTATFGLAFLLSLSWYVQANYFKNKFSLVAGQTVAEVHLKSLEDRKKPEEVKKPKQVIKKAFAQINHATIRIVPDKKADKPVPENKELNARLISLATTDGVNAEEGDVLPPSEGDKNGAVIEPAKEVPAVEMTPLVKAEVMPEFPGGMEAFRKFMVRNLREPDDLQEGEKIVVLVKFIVEADGAIVNAEILKSGGRYDEEVLKVIRKMPRWKPGIQNGRFVPVYFNLPVTFANAEN